MGSEGCDKKCFAARQEWFKHLATLNGHCYASLARNSHGIAIHVSIFHYMDPEDEKPSEDAWGNDPISEEITAQISAMPDRPAMVIAIINWVPEADAHIHAAFTFCKEAFLSVMPLKVFGKAFRIYYFGFETDSSVSLPNFLHALGSVDFAEAAVYTNTVPVLRLSRLKVASPKPSRSEGFRD